MPPGKKTDVSIILDLIHLSLMIEEHLTKMSWRYKTLKAFETQVYLEIESYSF